MRRLAAAVAALPLALTGSPAHAAPSAVFTAAETFVPAQVTIRQGDTLTLVNLENSPHDLVSSDTLPDGTPVFQSDIVGLGGTSEVRRVETLLPSTYPFYCTVHDTMTGLLTVT